jgi:predicted amidohydrolase YtcJ
MGIRPMSGQITRIDALEALPDHPVMIQHVSMHGAVLNSAALGLVGIDATTLSPTRVAANRSRRSRSSSCRTTSIS